jgi:hypothetical protein
MVARARQLCPVNRVGSVVEGEDAVNTAHGVNSGPGHGPNNAYV